MPRDLSDVLHYFLPHPEDGEELRASDEIEEVSDGGWDLGSDSGSMNLGGARLQWGGGIFAECDPDLRVIIRHEYQDDLGRSVIWARCRTCQSDFAVGVATSEEYS